MPLYSTDRRIRRRRRYHNRERGQLAQSIPLLSLVFPIYNEEATIPLLLQRLEVVFEHLRDEDVLSHEPGQYEVIFVDDGSRDRSLTLLDQAAETNDWIRVVSFSRNFGHQIAVTAGLEHTRGKAVVVLDADLQDPPELLQDMMAAWRNGSDVVYCVRKKRKEGFIKVLCYGAFYRLLKVVAEMDIPLDSGDFCLMDRKVVDYLCSMPERNRFVRGLRAWVGFTQTPLEYDRSARHAGETKYDAKRLFRLAADGIFSFSHAPLRFAGWVAVLFAAVAVLYAVKVLIWRIFLGDRVPGFATLAITILLLGSVQLLTLYFIGTYIGRIYDESKERPLYVVRKRIGFGGNTRQSVASDSVASLSRKSSRRLLDPSHR